MGLLLLFCRLKTQRPKRKSPLAYALWPVEGVTPDAADLFSCDKGSSESSDLVKDIPGQR